MKEANKPFVIWLIGLSGAGKTTIADSLAKRLVQMDIKNERLDGDIVRDVFPSTGFSKQDRIDHNKRVSWLASILERNGVVTIVSFISPYQESRDFTRQICDNYIEVHIATSLEECEKRDIKGLYKKARSGEIKNFTGIDDPFETPENSEITVDTENRSVEECTDIIIDKIRDYL